MIAERKSPYGVKPAKDAVPIFEDREEWERLCAVLTTNRRRFGRRESHLLSNIAVCALCDRPLIGAQSGDGVPSYGCRKRRKEPEACGGIYISKKYLDEIVTREALAFLSNRERVNAVLRSRGDSADLAAIDARINELEGRRVTLENDYYTPPAGHRPIDPDRYWAIRGEIEAELEQLDRRRAIDREGDLLIEARDNSGDIAEVWAEWGVNQQRQVLKLIVKRLEVRPGRVVRTKGKQGNSFDPTRVSIIFADE
jgi:hypothetical protein